MCSKRSLSTAAAVLVLALASQAGAVPRAAVERAVRAVVELVALQESPLGQFQLDGRRYVRAESGGSGTVLTPDGLILTNAHVVTMARYKRTAPLMEVRITGRADEAARPTYLAAVSHYDPKSDLATLQVVSDLAGRPVAKPNLSWLEVGSSDDLMLGDRLAIIGYPAVGGATITFTAGRVSGFVGENYLGPGRAFIKTDAKLSSGSSGGAALDEQGRLVGIPTSIYFDKQAGLPQESQNYLRPVALAADMLRAALPGPHAGSAAVSRVAGWTVGLGVPLLD